MTRELPDVGRDRVDQHRLQRGKCPGALVLFPDLRRVGRLFFRAQICREARQAFFDGHPIRGNDRCAPKEFPLMGNRRHVECATNKGLAIDIHGPVQGQRDIGPFSVTTPSGPNGATTKLSSIGMDFKLCADAGLTARTSVRHKQNRTNCARMSIPPRQLNITHACSSACEMRPGRAGTSRSRRRPTPRPRTIAPPTRRLLLHGASGPEPVLVQTRRTPPPAQTKGINRPPPVRRPLTLPTARPRPPPARTEFEPVSDCKLASSEGLR